MRTRFSFRKIFRYLLQGIIIIAPIAITIYTVMALFTFVDNILPDVIGRIFPRLLGLGENGNVPKIPGLGFIVIVLFVILLGYISTSFIVGRLVELLEKILERTPGIRILYTTLKDFFEAFAGNKRKFDSAVLVCVSSDDVWQVGFITRTNCQEFGLNEHVAVYVPKAYAFSGQLYFVQSDKIRSLTDISSAEAMKFAISGGVTELSEETAIIKS